MLFITDIHNGGNENSYVQLISLLLGHIIREARNLHQETRCLT
jgi:hypothetical protein